MIVIVFGVSGAGKTTIGKLLAKRLAWRFLEADDFHPRVNVEKMRNGLPLTDEDRWPWLKLLREQIERSLAAKENAVLACSALKRRYRERLRVSSDVKFVLLRGDYELIEKQLHSRRGHFMVIKIAFFHIKCDAIRCDLRRRSLLLVDQHFAIHNEIHVIFGLSGWMAIEKASWFATFEIDDDDRAVGGFRDERSIGARVDANIVEVTFLRRHFFTERDCLHNLVSREINLHQFWPTLDDLLHFWRCRIEHPQIILIVDHHALDADEMRARTARLVTFVVGKRFGLAINNLGY